MKKQQQQQQKSAKKVYKSKALSNISYELAPLNRDVICSKL